MAGASHLVMQLHPVTFRYKAPYDDGSHRLQYGLIAEEVAKIDPELVQFDNNGQAQTVRYHVVNMMLLNEVQRQEAEVGTLRAGLRLRKSRRPRRSAEFIRRSHELARGTRLEGRMASVIYHP